MKRTFTAVLSIVLSIFGLGLQAAGLQTGADLLINQVSPDTNIGIEVVDLGTGSTVFKRNSDRFFVPASNMKLFSDAAALMVLGPDYRFKNTLSTIASQLQGGSLQGSLYLHLSGDPSFTKERLSQLIASLKNWPIRHIKGNVIIDSSHAAVAPYAPGVMQTDHAYSYGAPIAPLMIDTNRTIVTVNPGAAPGLPAFIEADDKSGSMLINNQVTTKDKSARCGVGFTMDTANHITVRGCVNVGQWAIQQKMPIHNPLVYAQGLIREQLKAANIVLEGEVVLGKMPAGALLLAADYSKPISQLMADTLKPSDNLYADSLFLHTAHKLHGSPVNWEMSGAILKNFLQKQTAIPMDKAILVDGSGLSRNDRITAHQTLSLLRFLYTHFPLAYEYIAALPVSGRDGTLQRRFKRADQQELIRAKTGTMSGIIGLSGYLYTANDHTLAFAIYINRLPSTKASVAGKSRYLVDALVAYFLRQKPGNTLWTKGLASRARIQYQLAPTEAEQQRAKQARWRRLESSIKQALAGQSVAVVYRGNEFILKDNQLDANRVLNALQHIRKKQAFAIAVATKSMPVEVKSPFVFWIEDVSLALPLQRVWTIREAT